MNKQGFRRVAVFASVAALAGGAVAGCGSDSASSNTSSGANGTTTRRASAARAGWTSPRSPRSSA